MAYKQVESKLQLA